MTGVGALMGGVFLVIGGGLLLRAWSRWRWVATDALVISHNPATDMLAVTLGHPDRFGSVRRSGRGLPAPGMRLRVSHPPGDFAILRPHRPRIVDLVVGIAATVIGLVALLIAG